MPAWRPRIEGPGGRLKQSFELPTALAPAQEREVDGIIRAAERELRERGRL